MCGLVGFYPKKNKKAEISKIYNLWVLNEERGTHSCGISFGSSREVGVNTESKARDFIKKIHSIISNTNLVNQPIICHTRHATNGTHNSYNAHPFRWHTDEEEKEFFTFAHNGVIRDLYTLKKTLGMSKHDEKLMVIDSHVLGLAMYDSYLGKLTEKEILTQYEGNAAFICYDAKNVFKVWKGANLGVEERPLFYIENKDGWYFSSLDYALAITFLEEPIKVPNNTLITFKNNKLESSVVYSREIVVEYPIISNTPSNAFKNIMTSNRATENAKNNLITSGYDIVSNVVKLTLSHILKKDKEFETLKNSIKNITISNYGGTKGKYCIDDNLVDKTPLAGVLLFSKKDNHFIPVISNVGYGLKFQNGVLVKNDGNYFNLQTWFESLLQSQKGFEEIFNIIYEVSEKIIVDYLPLYNKQDLCMIIYKDGDKLNYISKYDKLSTVLPSAFNMKTRIAPVDGKLYITKLS